MAENRCGLWVPEDLNSLSIVGHTRSEIVVDAILESLKQDLVVLVKGVSAPEADGVMHSLASELDLGESLKLQVAFAGFHRHRHNIGKYFMSVNKRSDYEFIPPHSEGNSFVGMQLASFFCYGNSTDGGVTVLMNIDDSSEMWPLLRESVRRGKSGPRSLGPHELPRIKALYQLDLATDALRGDDEVLQEYPTEIPDLTILSVLAKLRKTYSRILDRNLYVLWDSVASIDSDCSSQYGYFLRENGLFTEHPKRLEPSELSNTLSRHVFHSGADYSQLFRRRITLKLTPGDLIVQNNLTWTHSASNWSPGSGIRTIAACFA